MWRSKKDPSPIQYRHEITRRTPHRTVQWPRMCTYSLFFAYKVFDKTFTTFEKLNRGTDFLLDSTLNSVCQSLVWFIRLDLTIRFDLGSVKGKKNSRHKDDVITTLRILRNHWVGGKEVTWL